MSMRDSHRTGLCIAVGSAVLFGFWPTAIRAIYANGGNIVFALLITTWVRAIGMAAFCLRIGKPLFQTRSDIRQAISGGFFQAVSSITMYMALEYMQGPLVIIIVFTHTIMLLFYMAWKGEVRLDVFTVLTTIVALGGLSLVLDIWHSNSNTSWIGIALSFVAAVATVSRLYVFGHQTKARHPIVVGAEIFIATAIFLSMLIVYEMPRMPTAAAGDWYAFVCCIAVTIGSFGMFYGISMLGSFRWSLFLKLEPVFTSIFAALLLNEVLKPGQYMGIGVVLSSLILYQIVEYRRRIAAIKIDTGPLQ